MNSKNSSVFERNHQGGSCLGWHDGDEMYLCHGVIG